MPKVGSEKNADLSVISALPVPQLRALRALAGGAALTVGALAGRAGAASTDALRALAAAGLVRRDELDLDGAKEVAWSITPAGEDWLASQDGGKRELPTAGMKADADAPAIGALVQVYGSNRLLSDKVGELLKGCKWVGIPFAGGLSELPAIKARTVVAGDLHGGIVNLARAVADPEIGPLLQASLGGLTFSELELCAAQRRLAEREEAGRQVDWMIGGEPDLDWARDQFVAAWMARAGTAGTKSELRATLSIRWNAGGGDSVRRWRNAVAGLSAWTAMMVDRVTVVCMDAFAFLQKCKDEPGHGVYADPPFICGGGPYKHGFSAAEHARLAEVLGGYRQATVVVRAYDDPRVREMYPRSAWRWVELSGKKNTNEDSLECLLVNDIGRKVL